MTISQVLQQVFPRGVFDAKGDFFVPTQERPQSCEVLREGVESHNPEGARLDQYLLKAAGYYLYLRVRKTDSPDAPGELVALLGSAILADAERCATLLLQAEKMMAFMC